MSLLDDLKCMLPSHTIIFTKLFLYDTQKITCEYEKKISQKSVLSNRKILDRPCGRKAPVRVRIIMLNVAQLISSVPREAFFLLGQFGLEECARSSEYGEEMVGLAGIPETNVSPPVSMQFRMKVGLPAWHC